MDKIFPNLIYKFKIPNYKELNKNLISEIYDLKNTERGIDRSNIGGWHSNLRITKFIDLQKIICNHYTKTILKTNKDIKPSTIWANVNNKNDSNNKSWSDIFLCFNFVLCNSILVVVFSSNLAL